MPCTPRRLPARSSDSRCLLQRSVWFKKKWLTVSSSCSKTKKGADPERLDGRRSAPTYSAVPWRRRGSRCTHVRKMASAYLERDFCQSLFRGDRSRAWLLLVSSVVCPSERPIASKAPFAEIPKVIYNSVEHKMVIMSSLKFMRDVSWDEVFAEWKAHEGADPVWQAFAREEKGWESWEAWRTHQAAQFGRGSGNGSSLS